MNLANYSNSPSFFANFYYSHIIPYANGLKFAKVFSLNFLQSLFTKIFYCTVWGSNIVSCSRIWLTNAQSQVWPDQSWRPSISELCVVEAVAFLKTCHIIINLEMHVKIAAQIKIQESTKLNTIHYNTYNVTPLQVSTV